MKPWVLTVVFTAAGFGYAIRSESLHALMCLGMLAMVWTGPATHSHGILGQALAVVFFLGAVWAVWKSAPASCLMALGMAIVFTPLD